jgi:metallo-beta-lactamase class B
MTIRDHGVPRRVLFLCSITVAGNLLVGNHAYPGIVGDFRATFAKLDTMHADIVLTGHPEMVDLFDRKAKADAGKADAYVDPGVLPALVAGSRKDFEDELAKAK